jgi:serine/threonine protein kinase
MKTGNHVQDGRGRTFQVGQLLGRGMWGKCYLVREESNDSEWVLKVPLSEDELPREPPRLAEACKDMIREQGRLLEASDNDALVDVESRFVADDGSPAILMPRYPDTLERRIANGAQLQEVLNIISEAVGALHTLSEVISVHGNLHPSNIMLTSEGAVRLMDPISPTVSSKRTILSQRDGYIADVYLPPETRGSADTTLTTTVDTYALATILYGSAMSAQDGRSAPPAIPASGLSKQDLAVMKDRVHNRLKNEPSNSRFHGRLSDRASALVNRALSVQTNPSPPFRFNHLKDFATRLGEVRALIHPTVTQVGKLLLNLAPGTDGFHTDEEIRFSCSIEVSNGVDNHEEIACGLAVFDTERNERLRDLPTSYTVDRHPSGRFRFSFRIANMHPGNFLIRVAFTIRDSGHEPATAQGPFHVRAAAGYVPPSTETARQPIPMGRSSAAEKPTEQITTQAEVEDTYNWDTEDTTGTVTAAPAPTPIAAFASAEQSEVRSQRSKPGPESSVSHDFAVPVDARSEPILPTNPGAALGDEPEYQGAGRWSELPLPSEQGTDLPSHQRTVTDEAPKEKGPIGSSIAQLLDLIRGDWYYLFFGGASVVIILLLAALWLIP